MKLRRGASIPAPEYCYQNTVLNCGILQTLYARQKVTEEINDGTFISQGGIALGHYHVAIKCTGFGN